MKRSSHNGQRPPSGRTGGRAALWGALGAAVALSVWCGCSVTKTNYRTLSFFFDGVPDPDAAKAGANSAGDATIAVAVVIHKPYGEEKCDACHRTQYRPGKNDASICLTCHDKLMNQHAWTHGAVAGGACLWCHAPHESARKWLLRAPDRKLCVQCHSATMMHASTVPAHADPAVSCLECHFGHGGDNSLMLRPGATSQSPPPPSAEAPPAKEKASTPSEPAGGTPASPDQSGSGRDEQKDKASEAKGQSPTPENDKSPANPDEPASPK